MFCSREIIMEASEKMKTNDPYYLFKENEIIIGNYRMVRDQGTGQWTIAEVSQICSTQAWQFPFRFILQLEGFFLNIDTLCFELSHSIKSSLRSLSTM